MNEIRQAVILAAGLGTHLKPHTNHTPKSMLPVAGRPILEWKIEQLPKQISEVVIVVGYLKEQITEHFKASWAGRRMVYVRQKELDGTGGALHYCQPVLHDRFLVMNGDDLYDAQDIKRAMDHEYAIVAHETEEQGRFGTLIADEHGNLAGIAKEEGHRPGSLVNTGIYAMDHRFFDYELMPLKNGVEFGLPQTLVSMSKDTPIRILKSTFWLPIGFPEDLELASRALEEQAAAGIML